MSAVCGSITKEISFSRFAFTFTDLINLIQLNFPFKRNRKCQKKLGRMTYSEIWMCFLV